MKQKFYVVWKGRKIGVFDSWEACKEQVFGFEGASYKSFKTRVLAQNAFKEGSQNYIGQNKISNQKINNSIIGKPIYPSLSVDAACSGNPGLMEYQGVDSASKKRIFHQGVFRDGTNNIGEFLGLVHGLALLKKQNNSMPIYTDSKTAMAWVRIKKAKTSLQKNAQNKKLFELIARAENWLKNNSYSTKILKWETKSWGEIPADFGRK